MAPSDLVYLNYLTIYSWNSDFFLVHPVCTINLFFPSSDMSIFRVLTFAMNCKYKHHTIL